jgi:hypothetical protein
MFSIYHLYLATGNSTTIEGWEKDKVATLVRRGKIHDVKYPYVSFSCLGLSRYARKGLIGRMWDSSGTLNQSSDPIHSSGSGLRKCKETDWYSL